MRFRPSRAAQPRDAETRQKFRKMLREGELDDREIEIDVARAASRRWKSWRRPAWRSMPQQLQTMFQSLGRTRKTRKLQGRARRCKLLADEEAAKLRQRGASSSARAVASAEQNGIVLHRRDRQDRVAAQDPHGADVSPRGRAARPAAAGRGHDGQHQATARSRPTTCCSSPPAPSTWPSPPT
jgi:ATP-dependent HslUV protease ATP-binding subunit HslU